jgi:hypothetical protein
MYVPPAKVEKSIKTGDHGGDFIMKATLKIKAANAANRLAALVGKRASFKNMQAMKAELDIVTEDGSLPTLNIARQWTAEMAQSMLSKGNLAGFLDSMRLWRNETETAPSAEHFEEWDIEFPKLWKVCPSRDEEELAAEEVPEEPVEKDALVEFKIARAFDKSVRAFGVFSKARGATMRCTSSSRATCPSPVNLWSFG